MKILFICTHNRCRSILSEAIANHQKDPRLQAASAGSQPVGEVHPLSIKYLQEAGLDTQGLKSQSWDDLEQFEPDVVVTVCDSAAGEACPVWFGKSIKLHWGLEDPSKVQGTDEEIKSQFTACIAEIESRMKAILNLDLDGLERDQLKTALLNLGASA